MSDHRKKRKKKKREKNTGWSKGYSSRTGTEGEVGSGACWHSEVAVPGAGHPRVGPVDAQLGGTGMLPGSPGHGAVIGPGRVWLRQSTEPAQSRG